MRIIYLHQYFHTPEMSGGTRSYEMARRLVDAGHEVCMVTSYYGERAEKNKDCFKTEEKGINVYWIPVPYSNTMSYRDRIKAFIKFAWQAGKKVAGMKGDLIFATSTPLTIALPAVYGSKKNNIPLVFEVRDLWPAIPVAVGGLKNPAAVSAARWLEKYAYNNSSRVIALSPGIKEGIVRVGYPRELITVIPNGCDLDVFGVGDNPGKKLREKYCWLNERPLVVYTGTIGLVNGVDYLACLAARAREMDPEIRFAVIGEGREEQKVRRIAGDLGVLNENFFMFPGMPKGEIPAWLSAADIAVSLVIDMKILWSNCANKFFDALASSKPLAINYGGWQAELLEKNGAGLVLDPRDINGAAEKLVKAIRDEKWTAAAGTAAGKLATECFARDKLALKMEEVLLEVKENI